jgi:hypothetical protein
MKNRDMENVREFPMTLPGKVQKFRTREIAIMEYGLDKEDAGHQRPFRTTMWMSVSVSE